MAEPAKRKKIEMILRNNYENESAECKKEVASRLRKVAGAPLGMSTLFKCLHPEDDLPLAQDDYDLASELADLIEEPKATLVQDGRSSFSTCSNCGGIRVDLLDCLRETYNYCPVCGCKLERMSSKE